MKALILSAGQGRRLLPLTSEIPKCMLSIDGKSLLEWQVDELERCGIDRVTVVVGYGADRVEGLLSARYRDRPIRTLYNPFFGFADNLGSCWIARSEMDGDFLLLNGDTLFEAPVVRRLLASPERAVTVTTDRKPEYDADDMKVKLEGERLLRVGKDIPLDQVDGESIGIILFRGEGPSLFRAGVEHALRFPEAIRRWYLSVIDEMARSMPVWSCSIEGLRWTEIDYPVDLERAGNLVRGFRSPRGHLAGAGPA